MSARIKLGETVCDKRDIRRAGMLRTVTAAGMCYFRDLETGQVYQAERKFIERVWITKGKQTRLRNMRARNGARDAATRASIPPERLAEVERLAEANGVSVEFAWRAMNE